MTEYNEEYQIADTIRACKASPVLYINEFYRKLSEEEKTALYNIKANRVNFLEKFDQDLLCWYMLWFISSEPSKIITLCAEKVSYRAIIQKLIKIHDSLPRWNQVGIDKMDLVFRLRNASIIFPATQRQKISTRYVNMMVTLKYNPQFDALLEFSPQRMVYEKQYILNQVEYRIPDSTREIILNG